MMILLRAQNIMDSRAKDLQQETSQELKVMFPVGMLFVNMANYDLSFLAYDMGVIQQALGKLILSIYGKAVVG